MGVIPRSLLRGSLFGEVNRDEVAAAMVSLDVTKIQFDNHLNGEEEQITGECKFSRAKAQGRVQLTLKQFIGLWLDYQKKNEDSLLEWLFQNKNITSFYFFGEPLRVQGEGDCGCIVLYLYRSNNKWAWFNRWLGFNWGANNFSGSLTSPVD